MTRNVPFCPILSSVRVGLYGRESRRGHENRGDVLTYSFFELLQRYAEILAKFWGGDDLMGGFIEVLLDFIQHDPGAFVALAGDQLDVFGVD